MSSFFFIVVDWIVIKGLVLVEFYKGLIIYEVLWLGKCYRFLNVNVIMIL